MKNELFSIGPFTVYGYGFMIAIGILIAYMVSEYRAKKLHLESEHLFYLVIWCVAGGFLSSKILFWITEWKQFIEDPVFFLRNLSDGFVVYGGIIGGILAGYLYCRRNRLDFFEYFDLVMPSVALAQGFGRIGCLLAGCCYGAPAEGGFSITFHESDFAPNDVPLIPTQIYSSVLDFIHFGVLLYIAKKKKAGGQVAACYLIFYSIGRFILEFFRGDIARGNVGVLSTSQFIGIFTGLAGVIFLMLTLKKKKRIK